MSHAPFHFLFNWPGDPAEPQRDHRINPHANRKADHWAGQSRRVILSGQLIYADTPPHHVDCVVLELCPGGARIEMIQAANIPDYLFFRIGNSPLRPVRRSHRQGNRIELRYIDQFEALK